MVVPDPESDDPFQHVLAPCKDNLATGAPLVYRTVMDDGIIKVEWCGESGRSASELLGTEADQCDYSRLEEACYVLYLTLADAGGGLPATAVRKEASKALVKATTLTRAKKKLKVRSDPRWVVIDNKKTREWYWILPSNETLLRPYRERAKEDQAEDVATASHDLIVPAEATTPTEDDVELARSSHVVNGNSPLELIVPDETTQAASSPEQSEGMEELSQGPGEVGSLDLIIPADTTEVASPPENDPDAGKSIQGADGIGSQDLVVSAETSEMACFADEGMRRESPSPAAAGESANESCNWSWGSPTL